MRALGVRRIASLLGLFSILLIASYRLNIHHLWNRNIRQHSVKEISKTDNSTKNATTNFALVQPCQESWFNWLNFSSTPCEDASDVLQCVSEVLLKPWKTDNTKSFYLKNLIESAISSNSNPILTKNNVKVDQKLHFGKQKYYAKLGVLTNTLYSNLPEVTSLGSGKLYKSCSVVGSSGILSNSSCGSSIDESDFVFRCNTPPLKPFSNDAGVKSNLSTMNLISVTLIRYNGFKTKKMKKKFLTDMKEYQGYLWLAAFAAPTTLKYAEKIITEFGNSIEKTERLKIVIPNPEQMLQMDNFLNKFANFKKDISTGFILMIWALTLCEETTLYGFWPFAEIKNDDGTSLPLKYHYYNTIDFRQASKSHSMSQEFQFLLKLHQNGILKVHHGKC